MRKIIASLDIGSSNLKLVVGEIVKTKVNVLACVSTTSRGIKNGFIVNAESAIESLNELFNKVNDMLGINVTKVIVAVPSLNLECYMALGSTQVKNEERIITGRDIGNALQDCVDKTVSPNMQIVSICPVNFVVNDVDKVLNPLGMLADKLTIKSVIGVIPKKNIMPIVKCLERIGVEVVDTILGSLGDFAEFKNKDMLGNVGAIINIGASNTTVSIFNKGILTSSEAINVGGDTIDNDISYVYKVSKPDALYLKEKLSLAHKNMAQPNESLIVENKSGDQIKVNQYDISEVCMQRLEEILNLAKKQINLLTKREISYIIVTGGVSEFVDFSIILDEVFNHKAKIGNVLQIGVRDNKYSTAYGLIKYFGSKLRLQNSEFSIFNLEQQEEFSGIHKKISINDNSILGKLFGYFFDN